MSEAVRYYMRLVAQWLIDDDLEEDWPGQFKQDVIDPAFAALSPEDRAQANQLVDDVFGEWL